MIGLTDLVVRVRSDVTGAISGLNGLTLGMIGLGVGASRAAVELTKMGLEAQSQLAIVQGFTGTTQSQMSAYTKGLELMSEKFGTTMADSARGLYYLIDAGFKGKEALDVLAVAMQGSQASGASLKDVSFALTAALNSYNAGAKEATRYSDIMTTAVTYGKQSFQDFAGSVGKAAATAAAYKIPFDQLAAAEASLTEKGIPANIAFTNMSYLLAHVGEDTKALGDKIKSLGGHFDAAKYSSLDLVGKLSYLKNNAGLTTAEFLKLIGGVRSSKEAFTLLADNGKAYTEILHKMQTQSGQTADAFKVHTGTMQYGFEKVQGSLSVLSYKLVTLITPAIQQHFVDLAGKIADLANNIPNIVKDVQDAATWFGSWDIKAVLLKTSLIAIGGAIAALKITQLVTFLITSLPMIIAYASAWWGAATATIAATWPILAIGAAIALLIAGIVLLVQHWGQVTELLGHFKDKVGDLLGVLGNFFGGVFGALGNFFGNVFGAIGNFFGNLIATVVEWGKKYVELITLPYRLAWQLIQTVWNFIVGVIQNAISTIIGWVQPKVQAIINLISGPFNWLKQFFGGLWNTLTGIVRVAIEIILKIMQDIQAAVSNLWHKIWDPIAEFFGNLWNDLSTKVRVGLEVEFSIIKDVWNKITGFLGGVWNGIKTTAINLWNTITKFLTDNWNNISKIASDVWNKVTGAIGGFIHQQITNVQTVWNNAKTFLSNTWDGIKHTAENVWNGILSTLTNIFNKIRDAVTGPFNAIKTTLGNVWKDIEKTAQTMLNNIITGFKGFINAIANAINWVAQHVGVKDQVPLWNPPMVQFPGLEKGTKNWPGGVAWVGEKGPELMFVPKGSAVVPTDLSKMLAGKNGIPGFAGGLFDGIGDFFGMLGGGAKSLLQGILDKIGQGSLKLPPPLSGEASGIYNLVFNDALTKVQSFVNNIGSLFGKGGAGGRSISGMPLINQLGLSDVNNVDDCVPTSIAAAASEVLGKYVNPVGLKDSVYGAKYRGGQSPERYRSILSSIGVRLGAQYGSQGQLVSDLLGEVGPGHPVIATIPSNWNLPSWQAGPGTHVVAMAAKAGNNLIAMNPWGGFWQANPSSWWRDRLEYGAVYPVSRYDEGGWINEPIAGIGMRTGQGYQFGWNGRPEYVSPGGKPMGQGGTVIHVYGDLTESTIAKMERERQWQARLHGGY